MSRKINIDRPQLSSSEIGRHKNFDAILNQYTAQSGGGNASSGKVGLSKTVLWTGIGIASVAGAVGVYFGMNNSSEVTPVAQSKAKVEWTRTSAKQFNALYAEELGTISPEEKTFEFVKFSSKKEWEEFRSNNALKTPIRDEAKLVLKTEEPLMYSSKSDAPIINQKGKSLIGKSSKDASLLSNLIKPNLLDESKIYLALEVDPNVLPSLKDYKEVFWQPVKESDYDESFSQIEWNSLEVIEKKGNQFVLILKKGSLEKYLNVYPALDKGQYKKAIGLYNNQVKKISEEIKKSPKEYTFDRGLTILY